MSRERAAYYEEEIQKARQAREFIEGLERIRDSYPQPAHSIKVTLETMHLSHYKGAIEREIDELIETYGEAPPN